MRLSCFNISGRNLNNLHLNWTNQLFPETLWTSKFLENCQLCSSRLFSITKKSSLHPTKIRRYRLIKKTSSQHLISLIHAILVHNYYLYLHFSLLRDKEINTKVLNQKNNTKLILWCDACMLTHDRTITGTDAPSIP